MPYKRRFLPGDIVLYMPDGDVGIVVRANDKGIEVNLDSEVRWVNWMRDGLRWGTTGHMRVLGHIEGEQ